MTKVSFSKTWKRSTQPRKQRKYRYNAPLHVKQKMMSVHLSSDLRKKYGQRNVQLKTGDKVRVMRGKFSKKEGKVERVNLKQEKVVITGLEHIKKDGTKVAVVFNPSNLMIISLELTGNRKIKSKVKETKEEKKSEVKKEEKKEEVKVEKKTEEKK